MSKLQHCRIVSRETIRNILFIFFILYLGNVFAQQEAIDSLETKIEKYIASKPKTYRDSIYVDMLLEISIKYEFYRADSLLSISKKVIEISDAINYPKGTYQGLNNIGYYHSNLGENHEAINYFKKVLDLGAVMNNDMVKIYALNDLGMEYTFVGDIENALKHFLKGLDVIDIENKEHLGMYSTLNGNIGELYARQGDYKTADSFYQKVLRNDRQRGDEVNTAKNLSTHAAILSKLGEYEKAMFNINRSIAVFEENKEYSWLAYAYGVKGSVYQHQKKYQWALYWYGQSETVHKNLEDNRSQIDLKNAIATAHLELNQDSEALSYANDAYNIAQKLNSLKGSMNAAKILFEINKKRKEYKNALAYHEEFQKISDSLSQDGVKKSLSLLKTKIAYDQQKKNLIETNEKKLAKQRSLIYISTIILTILLATLIPLYINQKRLRYLNNQLTKSTANLERRRAELNELNRTKDKLFSIIGHDLRGPIGALQGALKLFTSGELDKDDFLNFVPKLKTDVDHTLFTLNNLLTWGHSQMNGTKTRPKVTSIGNLVDNNINLLNELAAAKSIKIVNQLPEKSVALIDQDQIDLVLRNLISNAIKFTPKNGLITIGAQSNKNNWQIMVKDTGVGIDKKTIENIFDDVKTTSTYGTNNEKGTGLGLSLCHEMVINNGGEIWVESVPKSGSTFFFTVQKVEQKLKKAS
ncbi:tetratricopeptide repeat-containing sensor histidine kinase [uncultured Croceitalea sp.]|uniref:tetratricopeptide repeat-containing sensor histidine kinase n=1 Tax=uncultured Croceitalea sp. TaxID=1798908 RepID=UPI0033063124